MNGWLLVAMGALLLALLIASKRIRDITARLDQMQRMLADEIEERERKNEQID